MKIKNAITCHNCGAENEYYKDICSSCKAYLRAKVFNIDLWRNIWWLIESPSKAFQEIIFSEHKNYIVFILAVMGVKYFLNSLILSNYTFFAGDINETPLAQVFPAAAILIAVLFLMSFLFTKLLNSVGYRNRFKSVNAVLIYTFIPSVMIFAILSPIEFALFGQHWFYHNPSPFTLKFGAALVLFGVEFIIYVWGAVLAVKGFISLTGNKKLSLLLGLVFTLVMTGVILLLPFIY